MMRARIFELIRNHRLFIKPFVDALNTESSARSSKESLMNQNR